MKIYLISFFLLLFTLNVFSQSALSGKVTDADTGEPILFGDVAVYKDGKLITGEQTDFDGNYIISPMDAGKYSIVFKYVGYSDVEVDKVILKKNKEINLNAEMKPGVTIEEMPIAGVHRIPLVEPDSTIQVEKVTAKEIADLPNKNINGTIGQEPNTNVIEIIEKVKNVEKENNN